MLVKFKKINISLISKEDVGEVGRVSFAGKSFDSVEGLVSRFFESFNYDYVFPILVFLYHIWFVCFYDVLNRGVFRTLTNILDRTLRESSQ